MDTAITTTKTHTKQIEWPRVREQATDTKSEWKKNENPNEHSMNNDD